jgi:hypothetical protein
MAICGANRNVLVLSMCQGASSHSVAISRAHAHPMLHFRTPRGMTPVVLRGAVQRSRRDGAPTRPRRSKRVGRVGVHLERVEIVLMLLASRGEPAATR